MSLTRPAEGGAGLMTPYGEVTGPLPRCSSVCVQLCWGCHVCLRHRVTNAKMSMALEGVHVCMRREVF